MNKGKELLKGFGSSFLCLQIEGGEVKDAGGGRAEKPDPDGQRGEDDRTFVSRGNRQVCGAQIRYNKLRKKKET